MFAALIVAFVCGMFAERLRRDGWAAFKPQPRENISKELSGYLATMTGACLLLANTRQPSTTLTVSTLVVIAFAVGSMGIAFYERHLWRQQKC